MITIDAYDLGEKVYALVEYNVSDKTSTWSIQEAYIGSIYVEKEGSNRHISYLLETPSGEEWADCVRFGIVMKILNSQLKTVNAKNCLKLGQC